MKDTMKKQKSSLLGESKICSGSGNENPYDVDSTTAQCAYPNSYRNFLQQNSLQQN